VKAEAPIAAIETEIELASSPAEEDEDEEHYETKVGDSQVSFTRKISDNGVTETEKICGPGHTEEYCQLDYSNTGTDGARTSRKKTSSTSSESFDSARDGGSFGSSMISDLMSGMDAKAIVGDSIFDGLASMKETADTELNSLNAPIEQVEAFEALEALEEELDESEEPEEFDEPEELEETEDTEESEEPEAFFAGSQRVPLAQQSFMPKIASPFVKP